MRRAFQWCIVLSVVTCCLSLAAWGADGGSVIVLQPVPELEPLPTIPVLRNDRVVQFDPAELVTKTVYYVDFHCLDGAAVVSESTIVVLQGDQGVIENLMGKTEPGEWVSVPDPERCHGAKNLRLFCVVDASGLGQAADATSPSSRRTLDVADLSPAALAVYRDASGSFSFAGLKLTVYCPEADSFECHIERQITTAPKLMRQAGELIPIYVPGDELPFEVLGSFTAVLDNPDLGYVGSDGTAYGAEVPWEDVSDGQVIPENGRE